MASRKELSKDITFDIETRCLTSENVNSLFAFGKDSVAENVEINHLTKPVLMDYYNKAVELWN